MARREWQGDRSLERLLVNIDALQEHPENPRRGSVERIAESLIAHGQFRPLVAQQSTGFVLAGNHTWRAAKSLGWTHLAVVKIDVDGTKARQVMLADNRTSDFGSYDDQALGELLASLNSDDLLAGTAWTDEEVTTFLDNITPPPLEATPLEDYEPPDADPSEPVSEPRSVEPLREIVLMLRPGEFDLFGAWVAYLERSFGTSGSVATVYETVKRAAAAEGFSDA